MRSDGANKVSIIISRIMEIYACPPVRFARVVAMFHLATSTSTLRSVMQSRLVKSDLNVIDHLLCCLCVAI